MYSIKQAWAAQDTTRWTTLEGSRMITYTCFSKSGTNFLEEQDIWRGPKDGSTPKTPLAARKSGLDGQPVAPKDE